MYTFGKLANNDFIVGGLELMGRLFGDLWELLIDEPGGHFEEADWEEKSRTFTCDLVGL